MSASPTHVQQWRLFLQDQEIRGVLDVSYGLVVAHDPCGHPTDAWPRLRTIQVTRRATDDYDLAEWAFHPFQEHWKSGSLHLMDPRKQNTTLKEITWNEGFLTHYEEHLPHINVKRNEPQIEKIEIAVSRLFVNRIPVPTNSPGWGPLRNGGR